MESQQKTWGCRPLSWSGESYLGVGILVGSVQGHHESGYSVNVEVPSGVGGDGKDYSVRFGQVTGVREQDKSSIHDIQETQEQSVLDKIYTYPTILWIV